MSNLLVCQDCHGAGYVGKSRCRTCRGKGAGIFAGDYFLYWGGVKNFDDVIFQKLARLINKIIDFTLIIFSIFGFLNFAYFWHAKNFIFWNIAFWTAPDRQLLIFFLSLLGILYFGMRSTRVAHLYEDAMRLRMGEKIHLSYGLGWDNARERRQIDIARSFSVNAHRALEEAISIAKKYRDMISPEHLFLALLRSTKVKIIFGRLGIPTKILEERVRRNISAGREKNTRLSPTVAGILINAYISAVERKNKKAEVNLILLETVKESEFLREALYDLNVDAEKMENVVKWIEIQDKLRERWLAFRKASFLRPRGEVNRAMTSLQTPTLDRFGEDLTYFAKRGIIDFCIDREDIFESMFRIVEGGGKGVVLVGEHGVGKSAIIDGLAELMIKEDVPKILQDKRLIRLSLSEILGGSRSEEAGQKMMIAFGDAFRAGNIVLDIPNLEYFSAGESLPLAALLAEELKKSALPVFASTTPDGYAKVVEGTALAEIFERLDVGEPDDNLAIQILEAESSSIEYKEKVYFSYDAIAGAVKLSDKYLHEKFLPAKAMEIIKEAATAARNKRGVNSIVVYEDIANIVSEKSKVPVSSLTQTEKEKLLKLEEAIAEQIIGQKEAVDAVSRALRRARAGMHAGKRPIANFLFLGPTGVGKTELAKTIANVYFGGEEAMVRVDMSEYQDKRSVYRMVGGEGESGFLTEAVRKKPHTLVLLDELEKAHPDILNLFLQVMDDGRLTDDKGRVIDFTNVILVATSNAGSDYIAKEVSAGAPIENIKNKLLEEKLGAYFRPEFLNRFDGIIVFRPLEQEEIVQIAGLLVKKVAKKLAEKGIELVVEETALRALAKLGFDPKFGARPLRRVIAREVEDHLANLILEGKVKRRDRIIFHSLENVETVSAKKI